MEIRKSLNRFVSITLIVALGVAFYAGIQSSAPDMRYSGDEYFDEHKLMDLKVVGTLGLTEQDAEELGKIEGIEKAEPGYMTDVLCGKETQKVLHLESISPTLNQLTPTEGRLPERSGECFVDVEFLDKGGYEIGDTITFYREEDEDLMLKRDTYTIVGAGSSPLYISFNRGNTTLGNGELAGAGYLLPEDFDSKVYTQIYLEVSGARNLTAYTDAYDTLIEKVMDRVESIEGARCEIRYQEVMEEAQDKLADAKKELEDGREERESELAEAREELEEAESELSDGRQELADARKDLTDGEQKVADGEKEIEENKTTIAEKEKELSDGKAKLSDGWNQLNQGKRELASKEKEFNSQYKTAMAEITSGEKELEDAKKKISSGWEQYDAGVKEYEAGKSQYEEGEKAYSQGLAEFQAQEASWPGQKAELESQKNSLLSQKAELETKKNDLTAQKAGLESQRTELQNQRAALESQKAEPLNQKQQLESAISQIQSGIEGASAGIGNAQGSYDAAQAEIQAAGTALAAAQQTEVNLVSQKAALDQEIVNLQGQLDAESDESKKTELQNQIAEKRAQADQIANQQIPAVRNEISSQNSRMTAARETAAAAEAEKNRLQGTMEELQGQLDAQNQNLQTINGAIAGIDAGISQVDDGLGQVNAGISQIDEGLSEIESGETQINDGIRQIDDGISQGDTGIEEGRKKLADTRAQLDEAKKKLDPVPGQLEQSKNELEAGEKEIAANAQKLKDGRSQLEDGKRQIREAKQTITANEQKLLASQAHLEDGERQLADGKQKLADAEKELSDAKAELEDGRKKIADGEKELADGEKELSDGWKEYEDGVKEFEEKIADGEQKIADAEKELAELEKPEWIVSDRSSLPENIGYGENADRMRSLGQVFPVMFFLVAALISLTTMTRMVEEERTQIGTLKALGYSKAAIASKYMCYALIATLLGSAIGVLLGQKVLPFVIVVAYKIMYQHMPNVVLPYNLKFAAIATGAALFSTLFATFSACYRELGSTPAVLMRPPAPKEGKRVLLERIPFLWKPLSFTWKSTMRNLFRYKKRFFMTVFGIGGCMALMLVGYGLRDSIMDIARLQFAELQLYDGMVIMDSDASKEEREELLKFAKQNPDVENQMQVFLEKETLHVGKKTFSPYVMVCEDKEMFSDFVVFRDRVRRDSYELTDEGAIVTEKIAKEAGVGVGESISIENEELGTVEIPVAHITENYMGHYIYMTPVLYEACFGKEVEMNEILFRASEEGTKDVVAIGEDFLGKEAALSISYTATTMNQINDMLKALDSVMIVLIISAGLLAFVVLYNLNNININERKRELATIKVLGFYDGEVSAFVYRENIVLTIIGILAGVGLGIVLHRFTITTVEVDACMFGRNINLPSFLTAAAFTAGFSVFVNVVMHFKLKKIDMVESLKSVE